MAENLRIVTNNFFTLLDFTLYRHRSRPVKEVNCILKGLFRKTTELHMERLRM